MHVLARLVAAAAVALILSAAPAATAQVGGCVADPASCLPPAPDPGPCVADPASCVPPAPDPGPCVQDPASCVPPAPDPEACVEDPQGCLPLPTLGPGGETGQLEPAGEEPARPVEVPHEDAPQAPVVSGVRNERSPSDPGPRTAPRPLAPAPIPARAPVVAAPRPEPDAGGSVGGTVGGLTQAVRDFVFPLLLVAIVSVFLGIQSRIDRKDPKLALAPVDSRHDVVEFR